LLRRIYLAAVLAGILVSLANGAPVLRVNELDATIPLEVDGKGQLVITVAGAVNEQSYSVICEGRGKLEQLTKPDELGDSTIPAYRFVFDDNMELGEISLVADQEAIIDGIAVSAGSRVYKLALFYCEERDVTTAIGMDFEALSCAIPATAAKSEPQIFVPQDGGYFTDTSGGGTSGIDSFPEPEFYPNLNGDDIINFADFAIFANNWRGSGASLDGDFDDSGAVDINDLEIFSYFWLNGPHPVEIFGLFKAALAVGDVNEAVTYVTGISRVKYTEIFQTIEPHLSDYAAGMGGLTYDRHSDGEVKYEMLHQDGDETYSFPVFFVRDEDGNWRIFNF